MELLVLGSGTAVPHPTRGAPGYALRLPSGVLLLDTGPGSYRRWPALGIDPSEVRWIASTHYHLDHCADLPAILFALRVPATPRPERLTLLGPPGHEAFVGALRSVWGEWLDPLGYSRDVVELAPGDAPWSAEGFTLAAGNVCHSEPAVGYRVDAGGKAVAYSGDSAACEDLVALCRDADLAVLDCSTPDGEGVGGHMTPGEAGEVARQAGVRWLLLCHLYPACDAVDVVAQAKARFGGEVLVAADGMRLDVG